MTEADLIQALTSVQADIDAQFQFWISITFAVLIAAFIGGARLTVSLRLLVVFLYLSTTLVLYLRYLRGMDYFGYVAQLFAQNGFGPPPLPRRVVSISQARPLLFLIGTIASTAFVIFPRWGRASHPSAADDA